METLIISRVVKNGSDQLPNIWPYVDPPLYEPFWFEKFDIVRCHAWMARNWTLGLYICAAYLTLIYVGKKVMERRPPFELRGPLALWNLGFALFSIFGLMRCTPELLHVLQGPDGFHRSVCVRDSHNEATAFWAWLFTLSKAVELGDTAFIILRKKELLFVHYYHHGVALLLCWSFFSDYEPIFRWLGVWNYLTHAILYSYLFLKTIDVRMSRVLSKLIIFLELFQMVVAVALNVYAIWARGNGHQCEHSTEGIVAQMAVFGSFVVLFVYLFISSSSKKLSLANFNKQKAT